MLERVYSFGDWNAKMSSSIQDRKLRHRKREASCAALLMKISLGIIVGALFLIIAVVLWRGARVLSVEMIIRPPEGGYYLGGNGGILNAILGSLALACGATTLALIISLPLVLYLNVYCRRSWLNHTIRLVLDILWGVPSIVYGAFGFAAMILLGVRASLLGGIITLTLVEFPIMSRAMDEIVRMVPRDLRETTLALGTTPWELGGILLRQTAPGLVTAALLAFGRGIGDAAAVLFTAGYTDRLPSGLLQPVASLPLAIFFQIGTPFPKVQAQAYASAFVLTCIVMTTSIFAYYLSKELGKYVAR